MPRARTTTKKTAKPTTSRKASAKKTTTKKTTAKKATAQASTTKAGARRSKPKATAVPPEERHHMIETMAYLKAEARGFNGGDSHADWLSAEAEVDAQIGSRA